MGVLGEYYETRGRLITAYEATLINMSGDGLMILLNAPLPRSDPLSLGLRMSVEMQKEVQVLPPRRRVRSSSQAQLLAQSGRLDRGTGRSALGREQNSN